MDNLYFFDYLNDSDRIELFKMFLAGGLEERWVGFASDGAPEMWAPARSVGAGGVYRDKAGT